RRHTRSDRDWSSDVCSSDLGAYDEANQPLHSEVSYPDQYVSIRAWVPGAINTKKTVTFVYHVRRGVLGYAEHDELYWNATGNEWNAPINHAEAFVTVPPGVADADVQTAGFAGPLGVTGQDYIVDRIDRYWRFRTTRD